MGFTLKVNPPLCCKSEISDGKLTKTGCQNIKKYVSFPFKVAERFSIGKILYNSLFQLLC